MNTIYYISAKRSRKKVIRFTKKMLSLISKEIEAGSLSDEFDILDDEYLGAGQFRQFGRLAVVKTLTETTKRSEILYGLSFFICQQYITYIVSSIKKMHDDFKDENIALKTTDGSKLELLRLASKAINQTKITEVQAIDALANYYKHQDEWSGLWKDLKQPHAQTAKILSEIGLVQDATIFVEALKSFEIADFKGLHKLADILEYWGINVYKLYYAELKLYNVELEIRNTRRHTDTIYQHWMSKSLFKHIREYGNPLKAVDKLERDEE
jgi:hypothetical protein